MKFNDYNEKDIKGIVPNSNRIQFNTMSLDERKRYVKLYNLYRKCFTEYIINKLNLKYYDDKILNSNLNFKAVNKKDMDIYQYFSSDELKYLYIRNNIYLENLTEDERLFLNNLLNDKNYEFDKRIETFIEETYERVIFENICKDDKEYMVFYGTNAECYMASNKSFILGLRYDDFTFEDTNEELWEKQYEKQTLEFLPKLISEMKKKFEKELKTSVQIMKYNEFSVTKRTT